MTLEDWLSWKKVDPAAFAARIDVNAATLWRLRKRRIRPSWKTMDAIRRETDGHVTPNDFADLDSSGDDGDAAA